MALIDLANPTRFLALARWAAPLCLALAAALGRAGYRVVSTDSDNLGRGWAMVARSSSQHSFYDPVSAGWYA
ncbi:hypothetical protein KC219_28700, partial [Mycobacterium tuberculosis]|nr:hypothetical protein [Mycobacterium tuberculosis]